MMLLFQPCIINHSNINQYIYFYQLEKIQWGLSLQSIVKCCITQLCSTIQCIQWSVACRATFTHQSFVSVGVASTLLVRLPTAIVLGIKDIKSQKGGSLINKLWLIILDFCRLKTQNFRCLMRTVEFQKDNISYVVWSWLSKIKKIYKVINIFPLYRLE